MHESWNDCKNVDLQIWTQRCCQSKSHQWSNGFNASDASFFVFPNWWPVKVGQKKWSLATVFFGMRVTVKWVYGVRMCPRPPWIDPVSLRSWEFQKRLTCHLCVVVSKIRVWKRRDFKQSAIIEGAYLNVFFMSTLVGFSARWRSVIGSILHSAQCLIPTLCEMIYLIKRFST